MSESLFIKNLVEQGSMKHQFYPDKHRAEQFIEELFSFLFVKHPIDEHIVKQEYELLKGTFSRLLLECGTEKTSEKTYTELFFEQIPEVYTTLLQDVDAIVEFDPAAQSADEVIITYPGFFATAVYRLANIMWKMGIHILPRLFSEYAHSKTGIDIHPGARIGRSFAIDHGTGIVIGETTVIGEGVKIYQGVTLGALNVNKSDAHEKRHPTIEDNVVIYSGATILGGKTLIGKGSIIGGNVWLTYSVPPNSVVYHRSEIKLIDKDPFVEAINFII